MIVDDVFVILLKKYLINNLKTIYETNILLSGRNIKSEIDNERRKLILSIDEDRYFESQIWNIHFYSF